MCGPPSYNNNVVLLFRTTGSFFWVSLCFAFFYVRTSVRKNPQQPVTSATSAWPPRRRGELIRPGGLARMIALSGEGGLRPVAAGRSVHCSATLQRSSPLTSTLAVHACGDGWGAV
eukprot:gene20769-biopygen16139